MKRAFLLILMVLIGTIMLYLSRFWFLDLRPRTGLFGWEELRPGGDLIRRWLSGTPFAPFELLIWAVGVFLVLTWLQKLIDFIFRPSDVADGTSDED
ncbi:MAG: hypothetical protein AAFP98_06460 [Pseudomonadota bacterium]